jgi:hypothetical protein
VAYPEYDPNEASLGQTYANMLRGFKNPKSWQEIGQGIQNVTQIIPSVTESLGRGSFAPLVGSMGDVRDMRNTIQSYLPKSVQNFSNIAEFMASPLSKTVQQVAPTSQQTLNAIPRINPDYQGSQQHEMVGGLVSPAMPYLLRAGAKATEGLPIGNMTYRVSTPSKPDPLVGTIFEREFLGGLADKKPIKIEDTKGDSFMVMPWDASNRNYLIKSISGEVLPNELITHGGHDYTRDLEHIKEGIAGASNLSIAKRIQKRDAQGRKENLAAGGTGNIIHLPITMGEGDMNFSVMPTEAILGLIDNRQPSKQFIKELDMSIRQYKDPKKGTNPFKDFAGVNTEEGRMQLYTGEGVKGTAGDLRKVFVNRTAGLKGRQEYLGFNAEDLAAALRDPALIGVPKGYVGNTLIKVGPEGMHLRPSKNPSYSTDFTGQYMGSLGNNVPVEALFPKLFPKFEKAYAKKQGDLRNMAIGGLEKKAAGVSELIDQQVIDNYYKYLENMRKLGE